MLIKALCDYYDVLAEKGLVVPEGYSAVPIKYKIVLTPEGKIDKIISCQKTEIQVRENGKEKEKLVPERMYFPKRTEKPGIDANIAEHRPLYLFGLNLEKEGLTPTDRTGKAQKSHAAFVETNLKFIEEMDTPLVNAYRKFLLNWKPEEQTENQELLRLQKDYAKSGYVFCLTGRPGHYLQDEPVFAKKWNMYYEKQKAEAKDAYLAQCAVSGEEKPLARIHSKIKGVYGGLATGSVLIGYNNPSENSYGNEQSYNSGISEEMMKKYTEALNYLLASQKHKHMLEDMTMVFWAMDTEDKCEDLFSQLLFGESDTLNAEQTEEMLKKMMEDAREGKITAKRLENLSTVDPSVDFYMLGLKPNSSRLSVKFIIRKKYADVLWNIARFQQEIQVVQEQKPVPLWMIEKELISPKSKNDKVNPALMAGLLNAVVYGGKYPVALFENTLRRIRIDRNINRIRCGIVKAYLNRNDKKEEITVGLNEENKSPAYLCGRLFAVLEQLQKDAAGTELNRTIKDAYFASASVKPALIFPKLIRLSQNHLKKIKNANYRYKYNERIQKIIELLDGKFPEMLRRTEQGEFFVGYYQQIPELFKKSEKKEEQ